MNKGKRIVLTTHGTLGDLHPFLAIAVELRRRGHRPVIATSEYYRQKVEAAGIEFHPVRPDVSFRERELHRRLMEPRRGLERVIREYMFPVLRESYDDLLAAVQGNGGADLLISQILMFAAPLVAEKMGIPWVSTELQPGAFLSSYDPPVLAPMPALAKLRPLGPGFHRQVFRVARLVGRSWGDPVRELRRELGLPPGADPLFEGRQSPRLLLALFSPVLGRRQPDWPANTTITGTPFYDEEAVELDPELARFLDGGEPPIVFTLGSSAVWDAGRFYIESAAAAVQLGRRAVLLTGSNQPETSFPENILAVPYAPFAALFPRASVIVHQGGIGTTAQALRAGKPALVMPVGGDQFDNAARVQRLGAGRTIMQKQYRAKRVAEELAKLFDDPGYREKAEGTGRLVRAETGVESVCDAIERELNNNLKEI